MDKKYALVTGASGGIGVEVCKMLLEQDYFLYVNVRSESSAIELISKLKQIGGECKALIFDIRDKKEIIKEIACIKKIDILINNAGILKDNLIYNTPLQDWFDVVDTNFYAVDSF
ncbi:MAG TPA: beta-ketoacyl-ACP reductase, partial [Clostridiales bacterium]|nr:beta-ketoacyl-ACP reductase [Clostridiales bacterium]